MEADVAGGCYVPCQIDLKSGCVRDEAITYEALSARLLHRPELSEADLFKLPCEDYCAMYICNHSDGISRPRSSSYAVKVA